jgi:chromosome segregation ATPase
MALCPSTILLGRFTIAPHLPISVLDYTIKRDIHELRRNTQIIEEELITVFENLRRKNQTEILKIKSFYSQTKNILEGHSSRIEQVEDRISELGDKIEIKEKTEEILVKQLKSLEKNKQEFREPIKR